MVKVTKMEDFPECLQCGSIRAEILYICSEEDAIEYCKDMGLSQEWIDWVVNHRMNWENQKMEWEKNKK